MKKTDLALAVIARRGFAVKIVADTLGVSRSQLHSRLREGSRPRGRYQKTEDGGLLASIRTLTDDRPTYGYRRIWALLNRQRESAGLSRLNHKRIYRLMSQNGLLLQRYTGKPPVEHTTVRSSPSARICDGRRMASRSLAGTVRAFVSPSLSTLAIAR